ncbi:MAG: hypothetical protein WBQ94_27400 [Terracidiphilus sp.]
MQESLEVLITVKTYPIPSSKYDELVCTAGVTRAGDFIRLYPINFRDLPFSQQYRKYQWLDVKATKHTGRDSRKESYRPDCGSIAIVGEQISSKDNWAERSRYALAKASQSMEELFGRQKEDRTSLGIFRPKQVFDLVISPDEADWKAGFKAALTQQRLWENRKVSKEPPPKVPFKFHYKFSCEDSRCKGNHKMMIEDWEVGALYWRCVDDGATPDEAAGKVKNKFLNEICSPRNNTHFYVGTVLAHPKSWVVIGAFYPKKPVSSSLLEPTLFDLT